MYFTFAGLSNATRSSSQNSWHAVKYRCDTCSINVCNLNLILLRLRLLQFLMIINLISYFLPSEDQSRGGPGEVRRELSPERVQLEKQWADTAPGPKWEQWLDQAHPHHCRNNDVSALCERNKVDVLSLLLLSYLLTLIMIGFHCPVYSR